MIRPHRTTLTLTDNTCRRFLPLAALLVLLPLPTLAWNAAGHRLVASIAWKHLDSGARAEAAKLLRDHPDYARWIKRSGDDDSQRAAFIEASTWPDEIRKDKRFYTAGFDEATPLLPGYVDMERHTSWHSVKRPIDGSHPPESSAPSIDTQLMALAKTLGSAEASAVERRYALPWLIHLTGDVHQPLHTTVRLTATGKWDKLGSGLTVINPFNPHKGSSTLHEFWDDLPGPSSLRGERLESASLALIASQPRPKRSVSTDHWVEESWKIARESGYPDSASQEEMPVLSEAFFERSKAIADRRVSEAGYRLADLLNTLFKAKKRD